MHGGSPSVGAQSAVRRMMLDDFACYDNGERMESQQHAPGAE